MVQIFPTDFGWSWNDKISFAERYEILDATDLALYPATESEASKPEVAKVDW